MHQAGSDAMVTVNIWIRSKQHSQEYDRKVYGLEDE